MDDKQKTDGSGDQKVKEKRRTRAGRAVKNGIADFFGLGKEAEEKTQRWENRRQRYYKGKVKEPFSKKEDVEETDAVGGRYIYDKERVTVSGKAGDLRTAPWTSPKRGLPTSQSKKESVFSMAFKGVNTIADARKKLRGGKAVSAHDDVHSLLDDGFYDEPPMPPVNKLTRLREEPEIGPSRLPPIRGTRGRRADAMATPRDEENMPEFGMTRIKPNVMNSVKEEEKRQVGMGIVGRLTCRTYRSDKTDSTVKKQFNTIDDHRPYFTYWVTFVQVLIFIVAVSVHGIAPIGVSETTETEAIMKPNLAIESTDYTVADNLWIGPTQAALIHLGGKYSPCMRKDENIVAALALDRADELQSACCIRNDGSGCSQMTESKCSSTLSTFFKWNSSNPSPATHGSFMTGSVCGQDPLYCITPESVAPFEWDKSDVTNWPLCTDTNIPNTTTSDNRHMTCDISGRPCCHGIQGECMMTTRDHCDHIKGYYHEEKFLCSQVECMSQVCGMLPFYVDDEPDQFYRLWTSLFLHGGLVHLLITMVFQLLIMRDVEKLTGCVRMAIIYTGSGIAGNLASSIFLPYHVEVGPAGSQFGILACLLVEVLQSLQILKRPCLAVLKIGGGILFLFLLGFLPWIDNWAHLSGFLFGLLIAFAILPYVSFGKFDRRRKLIGIILSLGGAIFLFVILIILFYVLPLYNCPGCQYFNCIPFTADFCTNMDVSIDRTSTYSNW